MSKELDEIFSVEKSLADVMAGEDEGMKTVVPYTPPARIDTDDPETIALDTMKTMLQLGRDSIDDAMRVLKETENPYLISSLPKMLQSVSKMAKDLMEVSRKSKGSEETPTTNNTTNQINIFADKTTEEIITMLNNKNNINKNDNKSKD